MGKVIKESLAIVFLVSVIFLVFMAGNHYLEIKKEEDLYKHGFRLLEEQKGLYIIEHYQGVEKVEFSPIFRDGDGRNHQFTLTVVALIEDTEGNRACLGGVIDNINYGSYSYPSDFESLQIGSDGKEIIQFYGSDIDLSEASTLPKEAKMSSAPWLDRNIESLVQRGQLSVKKSPQGSPEAQIIYNTNIENGDYKLWR